MTHKWYMLQTEVVISPQILTHIAATMSTVAMMTVSSDIPFESEEEIATRLARYEKQFSNRYTEDDDWYAGTCQRTGR